MLYLDFFAVLNSLIYLLSIRVVNFSQKCHFDALKLIMSNQPMLDCDSLFESVLKNVDFSIPSNGYCFDTDPDMLHTVVRVITSPFALWLFLR